MSNLSWLSLNYFEFDIVGLGNCENRRRPRVTWVGVELSERSHVVGSSGSCGVVVDGGERRLAFIESQKFCGG